MLEADARICIYPRSGVGMREALYLVDILQARCYHPT